MLLSYVELGLLEFSYNLIHYLNYLKLALKLVSVYIGHSIGYGQTASLQ